MKWEARHLNVNIIARREEKKKRIRSFLLSAPLLFLGGAYPALVTHFRIMYADNLTFRKYWDHVSTTYAQKVKTILKQASVWLLVSQRDIRDGTQDDNECKWSKHLKLCSCIACHLLPCHNRSILIHDGVFTAVTGEECVVWIATDSGRKRGFK